MEKYTKEQIEQWAVELENMPEPEIISDELWHKIQVVATYVFNKYNEENKLTE